VLVLVFGVVGGLRGVDGPLVRKAIEDPDEEGGVAEDLVEGVRWGGPGRWSDGGQEAGKG